MTPYEEIMLCVYKINCLQDHNKPVTTKEVGDIAKKHTELLLSQFGKDFIQACRDDYETWPIAQKQNQWKTLQCEMFNSLNNQ